MFVMPNSPLITAEEMYCPLVTFMWAISPTTSEVSEKLIHRSWERHGLRGHVGGLDRRPEVDVRGRNDDVGRRRDGCDVRLTASAAAAAKEDGDQDERDDGKEDPDEQDQPIRALQTMSPRVVSCDRWHHSNIGFLPDT